MRTHYSEIHSPLIHRKRLSPDSRHGIRYGNQVMPPGQLEDLLRRVRAACNYLCLHQRNRNRLMQLNRCGHLLYRNHLVEGNLHFLNGGPAARKPLAEQAAVRSGHYVQNRTSRRSNSCRNRLNA